MTRQEFIFELLDDFPRDRVSLGEVDGCDDVDQLLAWRAGFELTVDNISAQIEARQFSGVAAPAWIDRSAAALSFQKMGVRRIERRLKALGAVMDVGERERLSRMVESHREAANKLRARVLSSGEFIEAAKALLPQETFRAVLDKASEIGVARGRAAAADAA